MKGGILMDNIDKIIIENLSGDIKLPNSFNYSILNALKKKKNKTI